MGVPVPSVNAAIASSTTEAVTTEAVTTAFMLGWQMARLYGGPLSTNTEPALDEDLPGLSRLPASSLVTLGLAQADIGLSRLGAWLGEGAALPTTAATRAAVAATPPDRDAIRTSILDLHVQLLVDLTAADYRLGKAYGLGRALADTCAAPDSDAAERRDALIHHLQPDRAEILVGWLDDLRTVLPAHAGHGVSDALGRWARWARDADVSTFGDQTVSDTARSLHRCGQRWRSVLSGEKDARDLLETQDYVSACHGVLVRTGAIARSVAWQLAAPLVAAAALVAAGLLLMFLDNSTAQVLAGLGTVAGGLGITWRSAATSLERVSLELGRPLWEAEIDVAVGNRLTPSPQREYLPALEPPRGRAARAWRRLRTRGNRTPRAAPPTGHHDASRAEDTVTGDVVAGDTPVEKPTVAGDTPVEKPTGAGDSPAEKPPTPEDREEGRT